MTTLSDLMGKLAALKALDPELELFGAQKHGYELAEPLPEAAVAEFETTYQLRLPVEYRQFLLEAGSGGAGPVYGLAPLAPWTPEAFSEVWSRITDKEGKVVAEAGTAPRPGLARAADPARPFPLAEAWGPPAEDGSNFIGAFPADTNPFDGCTFLAEIGCGYSYFLVLSGPHAGEVWQDYTAGDGQISPTGMGFFAWYEDWLDQGLAERASEAMALALKRSEEPKSELSRHIALVERFASESPTWGIGRLRVGIARAYQGRHAEAEAEFQKVLEQHPALALEVAVARCAVFWAQDRLLDVAEAAREGLESDAFSFPNERELHQVRVMALRLTGQYAAAIEASLERIEFEPDSLVAWLDKAEIEVLLDQPSEAEETLRKAASQEGELDQATLLGGFRALADRLSGDPDREEVAAHFTSLAKQLELAVSN